MKAFILRFDSPIHRPSSPLVSGYFTAPISSMTLVACGADTRAHAALGVDLRILFTHLIERRRLEVFHGRRIGLGQTQRAGQDRNDGEQGKRIHDELVILFLVLRLDLTLGLDGLARSLDGPATETSQFVFACSLAAAVMTASKAGLGWLAIEQRAACHLHAKRRRHSPPKVTILTESLCLRNAGKICVLFGELICVVHRPPWVVAALEYPPALRCPPCAIVDVEFGDEWQAEAAQSAKVWPSISRLAMRH